MSDDRTIILGLLRRGKKLEAIKLLRRSTGMNLKEAADEVERLAAAAGVDDRVVPDGAEGGSSEPLPAEVAALARQGKKIEAIRVLRSMTGMNLKDAKEKVEALAGGGVRHEGYGCFGILLLVLLPIAAWTMFLW